MRIFTDASVSGRVGGIACVITDSNDDIVLSRKKPILCNDSNFAELQAILFALEVMPDTREKITIVSDSQYALCCISYNRCRDFEEKTLSMINYHLSTKNWGVLWTKGHKNDGTSITLFNRLADNMARRARKDYIKQKKARKIKKITGQNGRTRIDNKRKR